MTEPGYSVVSPETKTIAIASIGQRFAPLRITAPEAERAMLCSLQKYGQLTPLVVCRIVPGEPELLDGFKRLRAGRELGFKELAVRSLEVNLRACKAAIIHLNEVGRAISSMEEALVVHSLCHEDGLSPVAIALLLGRHKSWVCRRLMLIERLSDEVQESIRLGLVPASLGAELARVQRCNQERLLAAIREQGLTWRETRRVVAALLTKPQAEHETILGNPREGVLLPQAGDSPRAEPGFSPPAQQLLSQLRSREKSCLKVASLCADIELGQFAAHEEQQVRQDCARTVVSLDHTRQALPERAQRAAKA